MPPSTCISTGICHQSCLTCTANEDSTKCLICNVGFSFNENSTPPNTCYPSSESTCDSLNCITCTVNNNSAKCNICNRIIGKAF